MLPKPDASNLRSQLGGRPRVNRLPSSRSRLMPGTQTPASALDPYRPHLLLRSGHLQTVFGALLTGPLPIYSARRHVIPLADGEALVVHEEQRAEVSDTAPVAILVHGLGGDHSSPYMRRMAARLATRGMRVWRVDLRGCGAGLLHAYRPAHAGSSTDLAAVVAVAQRLFPKSQIAIAAFSLGGNILLKMLGELAEEPTRYKIDPTRISRAIAVAPPADLHGCSVNMERLTRMPYTRYYLKMLGRQVEARAERWEPWRVIRPESTLRTIRQFDHWYTAPLGGFSSTDEYYDLSSSARSLASIQIPTRLLLDRHDPIIPFRAFKRIVFSPSIRVEITRFGGHLGYIARDGRGRMRRWMDEWTEMALREAFGVDSNG